MREETARRLRALVAELYASEAEDFAGHRTRPWPGFLEVVAAVPESVACVRILDVGCGPGRFGELAGRWRRVRYVGVDASKELLAIARERLRDQDVELVQADVIDWSPPHRAFDLVVAAALLHHVPSSEARTALVARLAGSVAPGGLLALTTWDVDAPRARPKHLPWSTLPEIDESDLEPGDRLLRFRGALRYVHAVDEAELTAWIAASELELERSFRADGPSADANVYLLLRRWA
ncbi:MAG: class I SAM-dependent methyltransferase [Deltaproteobacteria bacterium]|nr:class I SAM-dependent methyltransferase [Deltaproteobacteria bacterium]